MSAMSATRAFVAAPVAAKLSASRKSATGKPYKAGARRSVAVCAKTSAPELDINTKVFEKELVDVAGEGEYIVRGGRHLCLLYTSPSPRDATLSRMPSSA